MATTTNYGWTTPNDTDLVKDGAAAIRTLGSSVDTTTKNLNPQTTTGALAYRSATANVNTALPLGTANQVLRVNSGGTAPEWATTADQTPLTTKGDLFTFDTADARLGVGANGTVLTADSTETTGLKWAASAGGGMTLINIGGTTLTGSSVSIQSIPATYNELRVYLVAPRPANNNAFPAMIYNNDGTAKYRYAYDNADNQTFSLSDLKLNDGNPNTDSRSVILVRIPQYASTASFKMNLNDSISGATDVTYRRSWGAWNQYATAVNRLDFYNNTGNWSSGTVYVYGVK